MQFITKYLHFHVSSNVSSFQYILVLLLVKAANSERPRNPVNKREIDKYACDNKDVFMNKHWSLLQN